MIIFYHNSFLMWVRVCCFLHLRDNPHPAIGVATVILAFIQPIMAFFRSAMGFLHRYLCTVHYSTISTCSTCIQCCGAGAELLCTVGAFWAEPKFSADSRLLTHRNILDFELWSWPHCCKFYCRLFTVKLS